MKVDTWFEGETGAILSMVTCSSDINNLAREACRARCGLLSIKHWKQLNVYELLASCYDVWQ